MFLKTYLVFSAVLIHYFLLVLSSAYHRDIRDIVYCRLVR